MEPIDERFYTMVNKNGPIHPYRPELGSCWLWEGCKDKAGYGHFHASGRAPVLAHRFVMRNELPPGMDCLHSCDRPSCVNKAHLFAGTHTDNMRDSISKGRNAFKLGEAHNLSKLTDVQAMLIKACPMQHGAAKRMTAAFGMKRASFYYIKSGRGWPHLPKPTAEDMERSEAFLRSLPGRSKVALKVTDEQAALMRACPTTYGAATKMARGLGVCLTTLNKIRSGEKWPHLPPPTPADFTRALKFLATLPQ